MPRFAEVKEGRVVGVVHSLADIADGLILVADGEECELGFAYDGVNFSAYVPSEEENALAELVAIDRETGMARVLREALIDLLPPGKGSALRSVEARAAIERGKLGGGPS